MKKIPLEGRVVTLTLTLKQGQPKTIGFDRGHFPVRPVSFKGIAAKFWTGESTQTNKQTDRRTYATD